MFLDIKELAVRKARIHKIYPPGTIDFHSDEFQQLDPLEVRATAEMAEEQIRIYGEIHTRLEMPCARCLDPVAEEINREFDLYYRPMKTVANAEVVRLDDEEAEVGFYDGDGIFLADILAEQVNLAIPMKTICRTDCRGLCPHCGVNMNHEECHCQTHAPDPRLAPLARVKQVWFKKQ
jgi:uncharacterized protein